MSDEVLFKRRGKARTDGSPSVITSENITAQHLHDEVDASFKTAVSFLRRVEMLEGVATQQGIHDEGLQDTFRSAARVRALAVMADSETRIRALERQLAHERERNMRAMGEVNQLLSSWTAS